MSNDVIIEIHGKLQDAAAVRELAKAIAEEASLDWESPVEDDEVLDLLKEAQAKKKALVLTRSETKNLFDAVTSACQEANLSYVARYGRSGDDGYSDGFSWRPGDEAENHFELYGEDPVLGVQEVRKLMTAGGEALENRVSSLEAVTAVGAIEIEDGFVEAYEAIVDAEENPSPR